MTETLLVVILLVLLVQFIWLVARARRRVEQSRSEPEPETRVGSDDQALTPRELEIARLAAARKTNQEIAAALCITPHTVNSHMKNIFRKLSVRSRAELERLFPPPPSS